MSMGGWCVCSPPHELQAQLDSVSTPLWNGAEPSRTGGPAGGTGGMGGQWVEAEWVDRNVTEDHWHQMGDQKEEQQ